MSINKLVYKCLILFSMLTIKSFKTSLIVKESEFLLLCKLFLSSSSGYLLFGGFEFFANCFIVMPEVLILLDFLVPFWISFFSGDRKLYFQ